MNQQELTNKLLDILKDSKTGILSTVDLNGNPDLRWMTPILVKGRSGVIFAVTSINSDKINQLSYNQDATWLIQTRSLDQIITIKGKVNVLDNASIKNEVLELMGNKLTMFWKINTSSDDFVVLETIIEEAEYFQPMKGNKQVVKWV